MFGLGRWTILNAVVLNICMYEMMNVYEMMNTRANDEYSFELFMNMQMTVQNERDGVHAVQ